MIGGRLAALWLRRKGDWHQTVSTAARRHGLTVSRVGPSVVAWGPKPQQGLPGGGRVVGGWRLGTLWLGLGGRNALAACPRLVYLKPDGTRDRRPQHEILDGGGPPAFPMAERWPGLLSLLDSLRTECRGLLGDVVALDVSDEDPLHGVRLLGARRHFAPDTKLASVHAQGGFLSVPEHVDVRVVCDDDAPSVAADGYVTQARQWFRRFGVDRATVGTVELTRLEARLEELDQGGTVRRQDVPILFVLKDRAGGSKRLRSAMRKLDRHHLPWRRAYATDDQQWSVRDQVGSLLQAAGGHPHGVRLAGGERLPWSIGVDVSHRKELKFSRVAACLTSPGGRLAGCWTCDQKRNGRENIESAVLRRLLTAAMDRVPTDAAGVLILRDGRVFESESLRNYLRHLGTPVTLVEVRKYNNPPILLGDDACPPRTPNLGWLPNARGGSLGFLHTLPVDSRGKESTVPLKIWMSLAWDGLGLGAGQLARVLFAQTLTPGLGLHRRKLPAPIYWADGIAGASDTDLRFRGQRVVDLTNDLVARTQARGS